MQYYATRISENRYRTPEGYLLCVGVPIGRVGTMDYGKGETPIKPGKNGITKISRDEKELFSPKTIASFQGKPFTIRHPEDFVNPENWKDLAKGTMQNVRRGEGDMKDDLVCDILITDKIAISLVEEGVVGLSCGYEAEYVETGEGEGIQRNIIGNHLALVEEGRAGDAYQIRDSKSKGAFTMPKKLKEALEKLLGTAKAIDEAMKEEPAKDEDKDKDKSEDAAAYDELIKICDQLKEQVGKLASKGKDQDKPEEEKPAKDEPAGLEDRLKALELAVAKLLEHEGGEEAGDEDKDKDEDKGEDEDPVIEAEDEDKDKDKDKVGDEDPGDEDEEEEEDDGEVASRAEILAPGIKMTKDVKSRALETAYKTKDGKRFIDALSGGKPDFKKKETVDMLFTAASELIKSARKNDLSKTKDANAFNSSMFAEEGTMTPEKMNELNDKHYNKKK